MYIVTQSRKAAGHGATAGAGAGATMMLLVQAHRTWNEELNAHMEGIGFSATVKDHAVYVKGAWDGDAVVAGGLRVNDFVGIGSGRELDVLAKGVDRKYGITGLGEVKWVLGMLVERDRAARMVCISQEAFINSILTRFNLVDAATVSTPLAAGSFLSASDCPATSDQSRSPCIRFAGVISRTASLPSLGCSQGSIPYLISSFIPLVPAQTIHLTRL